MMCTEGIDQVRKTLLYNRLLFASRGMAPWWLFERMHKALSLPGSNSYSFILTENKTKRELIRLLVQKGFESDPVAAWSKSQEKVLLE